MGTEGYPKVIKTVAVEGYDGLLLSIVVNLSGAEFEALVGNDDDTLGPALVTAYNGGVYQVGGAVLDFSSPEAALATLRSPSLPMDLRYWVRNAAIEAIDVHLEGLRGNFRRCFEGIKNS